MKVVGTRVCVGRAFEGMREGGSSRAKGRGRERGAVRERGSMCASRGGARALKVSSFPGGGYSESRHCKLLVQLANTRGVR